MESTKPPSTSPCNSETNNIHQIRDALTTPNFYLDRFPPFSVSYP